MLEKYLQEIGLSDKEAQVYVALLQVDNDSVLDLARRTKINRTTIYPVLESLAKKGLITEVQVENKVRFEAQSPERLETYIERQKMMLEESAKRLHSDIVPQLKGVQREIGERPVVKYFEGKDGLLTAAQEFFESRGNSGTQHMIYSRDLVEKRLDVIETRLNLLETRLDDLERIVIRGFDYIATRFEQTDNKIDKLDHRLQGNIYEIKALQVRVNHIEA